jgi:hypothetical protein
LLRTHPFKRVESSVSTSLDLPYKIKVPLEPRYYYQFQKHKIVGLLPKSGVLSKHTYRRNKSPFFSEYKNLKCIQFLKSLAGDKFATVIASQENVDKTIKSWDKYGPEDAICFETLKTELQISKEFFKLEYGTLFKDIIADAEEIMNSFDMTKSPGFPATHQGIRTKEQYFKQDISKLMEALRHLLPVIYNGVPKVEVKDMVDILDKKIRIFCVSPAHYLYFQKKFTLRLSERFKLFKWSAYGINLYSSGANKLCTTLLGKWARFCYDISGWDKFIPLMSLIYEVQRELMKDNQQYNDFKHDFEWVVQNLIEMFIRLPNGEVLLKKLGNPSGSGSTTLDNIRMHIVLFSTLLAKAYFDKNGEYPTLGQIAEQIAFIFGDDIIGGIDEPFSLFVDRDWLAKHLRMFNLELKFLYINTTNHRDERDFLDDLTGEPLSFLGATFNKKRDTFIPCYDPERLAHSCVYDLKKIELTGYLSKIMTLTVMSYGSGYFPQFLAFFKDYCNLPEISKSELPEVRAIREIAYTLDEDMVHEFYTGLESSNSPIAEFFEYEILSFFAQPEEYNLQIMEEEVLNYNLLMSTSTTTTTTQVKSKKPGDKAKIIRKTEKRIINPKPQPKKAKVQDRKSNQHIVQAISPCAANYLKILCDPWDFGKEACLPADLFPLPSNKNCAFSRTTMKIGLGGIGFVWMRPIACNDQWSIAFTNAASTGGLNTALSGMGGSSLAYLANCPYTAAMFGNDEILARNTSIGVRIKYTGELMNRNGVCYTFEHPDRDNLDSWTIQEVIDSNFCKQQAVLGKKWDAAVCASGPIAPQNLEYTKDIYQGSSHVWIGIIVTGKPGDSYMVDYANRTEYIGSSASQKTPTRPAGSQFGSAVAATKDQVLATGPLKPTDTKSVWDKFKEYVSESVPMLAEGAKMVGGLASTVVSGNPIGIVTAAGSAVNLMNQLSGRGAVKEIGFGGGNNKLQAHQIQATKHHGTRDVKSLSAAHEFTPYDPLVRDMFNWIMFAIDESAYYSYIPLPKSEKFMKPFDTIFGSLTAEQVAIGGYLAQVNESFFLHSNDPGTFTHAEVLTYLDLVQDLLDAYFSDDVPPLNKAGSKLSKEEKPPLIEEPAKENRDDKPNDDKKANTPAWSQQVIKPRGILATILTYYPVAFEPSDEFKQAKRDLCNHVQSCFPNLEISGVHSDISCLEDMYILETSKGEKSKYNYLTPEFRAALLKEKNRQNQLFLQLKDANPC